MPDSNGETVLDDLPESIVVQEILVRLPSKDVLRCRAVQKSWRCATSTNGFMLAHHRRQPSFPIIKVSPEESSAVNESYVAFDTAGASSASRRLLPVLCTSSTTDFFAVEAACDGFLVVSNQCTSVDDNGEDDYFVCNPATRQCAPIPQLSRYLHIGIAGFYRHQPSEEYRVLYWIVLEGRLEAHYNILTVGSHEPRFIYGVKSSDVSFSATPPSVDKALRLGMSRSSYNPPVLHHGNMHWEVGWCHEEITDLMVFDTVAETFRWMRRPSSLGHSWLLEMDGALALSSTVDGILLHFSVVQDYEAEVWVFKFRINLSVVVAPLPLDSLLLQQSGPSREHNYRRVALVDDHQLLIQLPGLLFHCDVDGRFIGSVECKDAEHLGISSSIVGCLRNGELLLTSHLLQESILPLPSFELREEDGVSKPHPFTFSKG